MKDDDLIYRKTAKEMFLHAPMTEDEKILVFRRLNAIPAVDAVEVRHAYWQSIAGKSARVCSRCEKDEPYKFADEDADIFEYCPHCGARMDGRREDEHNAAD